MSFFMQKYLSLVLFSLSLLSQDFNFRERALGFAGLG